MARHDGRRQDAGASQARHVTGSGRGPSIGTPHHPREKERVVTKTGSQAINDALLPPVGVDEEDVVPGGGGGGRLQLVLMRHPPQLSAKTCGGGGGGQLGRGGRREGGGGGIGSLAGGGGGAARKGVSGGMGV